MKRKSLTASLVIFLALVFWHSSTWADVTGSLGLKVTTDAISCQLASELGILGFPDQPCEMTFFRFDFETDFTINMMMSGFTLDLHSHAGVTGFEDIILSFHTTLGAVDIADKFVFAQPYGIVPIALDNDGDGSVNEDPLDGVDNDGDGQIDEDPMETGSIPVCYESSPDSGSCLTLFVKKRVEAAIAVTGLTFRNLAIIEDINFPIPGQVKPAGAIYTQQSQAFGFGDLITISGQTSSGITITGQTSFCLSETRSNLIKKHSFSYIVNPDCVSTTQTPSVKPPVLFEFEEISITGIPIASNFTSALLIHCTGAISCLFENTLTISNALPLFSLFTAKISFTDVLGAFAFSNVTLRMQSGTLSLILNLSPLFTVSSFSFLGTFTINPVSNPASLSISASGSPNTGLNGIVTTFRVNRFGATFSALSIFTVNSGLLNFSQLVLRVAGEAGVFNLEGNVAFRLVGLASANLRSTINF